MSKSGNLTIVIQAGGESRRMGRSKATVPFLGEPLIWRGINRLLPLADEFLITTNEPENLGFLDDLVDLGKIRLVTDVYEKRGALRGVYTAIDAASKDFVALVACDMIFPSRNLIASELEALMREGKDVAVPLTQFGYEPFHGVYRRATCLPAIKKAVEDGETKATSWFDQVGVIDFTSDMIAKAEPRGGVFMNVNTPEELEHAEKMIIEGAIREREAFKGKPAASNRD
jgi:molybdopterin-guanine dinucleotide biosynthesis protein A